AMIERAAMQDFFSQHLAADIHGFPPRCFQIGEVLAFGVAADIVAVFTHMEKETGHFAEPIVLPNKKQRFASQPVPVPVLNLPFSYRNLRETLPAPYKPVPRGSHRLAVRTRPSQG